MTEQEQEILKRLLLNLFLENPRRKSQLSQQEHLDVGVKTPSSYVNGQRVQPTGGEKYEQQS